MTEQHDEGTADQGQAQPAGVSPTPAGGGRERVRVPRPDGVTTDTDAAPPKPDGVTTDTD